MNLPLPVRNICKLHIISLILHYFLFAYYVVCINILCNNVSFYRYRVSQEDGSMLCDRPVNVLLYLMFYYCAKLHILLPCH